VTDGVTSFYPAQQGEHRLLGLDRALARDLHLRVELYQKRFADPMPRWENLLNPIEILPELEADRVLVDPDRARAEGFEIALRRDGGRRWSWWASYTWARADDDVDGEWVPRSWDQRHTVGFDVNFRPNAKWNFNLGGIYHTGWPTTAVLAEWTTGPDGSPAIHVYPGPRNQERLPYYLRIDARASRDFRLRRGSFSLYLEIMNPPRNLGDPAFWLSLTATDRWAWDRGVPPISVARHPLDL
jgi:hypothetical protein